MKTEIVNPNISNFVESLRDIGYTFEIAIADIIDNSISASAQHIDIIVIPDNHNIELSIFDNGHGMNEYELTEAMRLATKSPYEQRSKNDLGRYGLGLKTASFSQCKKLIVASKRNNHIVIRCWDLDFIAEKNSWELQILQLDDIRENRLYKKLYDCNSGTLVIWEKIDRYTVDKELSHLIYKMKNHLSLVFHRFLEEKSFGKSVTITVNNEALSPFNPFHSNHPATSQLPTEHLKIDKKSYSISPYILPHHSKVTQEQWEKYATDDGYIKSQGFYLYREKRLLIHGTWWGLHKATDAHKLARIQIDISNDQDQYWGIDVKKSTAHPIPPIKEELKRIITNVTKTSFKPFQSRGRKIEDKTIVRFWTKYIENNEVSFRINTRHPLLEKLKEKLHKEDYELLKLFYEGLESFLPLSTIQAEMQKSPHSIKQNRLSKEELNTIINSLRANGFDEEWIERFKQTELIKEI